MRVAAITPFLVDKELPGTDEHRADAVSKAMHPSLHFPNTAGISKQPNDAPSTTA